MWNRHTAEAQVAAESKHKPQLWVSAEPVTASSPVFPACYSVAVGQTAAGRLKANQLLLNIPVYAVKSRETPGMTAI